MKECNDRMGVVLRRMALALAASLAAGGLTGCLVVGHSSTGGWFIWPGGLGLVVVILFVVFLLRRR